MYVQPNFDLKKTSFLLNGGTLHGSMGDNVNFHLGSLIGVIFVSVSHTGRFTWYILHISFIKYNYNTEHVVTETPNIDGTPTTTVI